MIVRTNSAPQGPFAELLERTEACRDRAEASVYRANLIHIGYLIQRVYVTAAGLHIELSTGEFGTVVKLLHVVDANQDVLWSQQGCDGTAIDVLTRQQVESELQSALAGNDPRVYWREDDVSGNYRVDLPHPHDIKLVAEGIPTPAAIGAKFITKRASLTHSVPGHIPVVETAGVRTSQYIDGTTGRLVVEIDTDDALPALRIPGTDWINFEIIVNGRVEYTSADERPFLEHSADVVAE